MKIEICHTCEGKGTQIYYPYEYSDDWEIIDCPKCTGTGRLYTKEYKLEMSFGEDVTKCHKIDTEIIRLIRQKN